MSRFAPYPISVDQLEEGHALVLGTTGSGKTYQLRGMLEQLRRADRRVGAVDKLGNHWGLTLAADGRSPGLEFVIFGGKRAHVPMTPGSGAKLGRLFVERNIPAIFDVSQWKGDEQQLWVSDFADAVFRHNEGALHLALDEAQSWAPQGGGGEAFRSVRLLAEQGRGNGLRLLLSCQRLSRLDATVREMAHLVVAMRQTGTLDRKAVRDLVSADAAAGALIERELPRLPVGAGYVWSAGDVELRRVEFPANATFDSSRTPKHGDTPPPPIAVSSALVDELRAALAPTTPGESLPDDTVPADPAAAYAKGSEVGTMIVERDRRIAELEEKLAASREMREMAERLYGEVKRVAEHFRGAVDRVRFEVDEAMSMFDAWVTGAQLPTGAKFNLHRTDAESAAATAPDVETAPVPIGKANAEVAGASSAEPSGVPTAGDAPDREYRALAGLAAIYPAGLTEAAWASRTGYSRKGGAWIRRRTRYRDAELIEQRDGRWFATAAGVDAAGAELPDFPPPGPALIAMWAQRLGAPGRLLTTLGEAHPRTLDRVELAIEVDMVAKGGAFIRHVAALKSAELVTENGKRLGIAPGLMGES